MSIRVMSHVWANSKHKGAALLLLLAIADYANDEGTAWPAMDTLAEKIRMSERYTRELIKDIVKSGELSVDYKAAKNGTNRYQIMLEPATATPPSDPEPRLTRNPASPGTPPPQTRNPASADPEPRLTRTIKNRQEPSDTARRKKDPPQRDELFDAIAEVCRVDPHTAGSAIGKVRAVLAKASPPYTPAEVRAFGVWWWGWKDRQAAPTIWQLQERIGQVRSNGHKPAVQAEAAGPWRRGNTK